MTRARPLFTLVPLLAAPGLLIAQGVRLAPDPAGIRALIVMVTLGLPSVLLAQGVPLGPEFRVNTYTTSIQMEPGVASDSAGGFVIVWRSHQGSSDSDIFAQRYAGGGAPLGGEFRVNTFTTFAQDGPTVAVDASGSFIVLWNSSALDGSTQGINAQRYSNAGVALGVEFRVNTFTTNLQSFPDVAFDSAGNFVVVWQSLIQDGHAFGVFAQRYSGSGAPLGAEFRVNTYTTLTQQSPSIGSDSSGNFIVTWYSNTQDGHGYGVFAQRFASTGAAVGAEFQVNTHTTLNQQAPSVACDSVGNFVLVWESDAQDGDGQGVFGQRYASTGVPLGGEFRVNTYTTSHQLYPMVASDASGNFVITWASFTQDGSDFGVFGQRYASSGVPLGGEFRVNTFTTDLQSHPVAASDPTGRFVVVWTSEGQDGSTRGIYAQRYSMIVPVELQHFRVE